MDNGGGDGVAVEVGIAWDLSLLGPGDGYMVVPHTIFYFLYI